jgi:hypothetical protein
MHPELVAFSVQAHEQSLPFKNNLDCNFATHSGSNVSEHCISSTHAEAFPNVAPQLPVEPK